MRIDATAASARRAAPKVGVILSASYGNHHQQPRTVRIGLEEGIIDAIAFNAPWLDKALELPLTAWVLRLAKVDDCARLPILLGLEEDVVLNGWSLLPDAACPVAGTVHRIKEFVAGVKAIPLRTFLTNVFQRRDVTNAFWTMPASGRDHHRCPGGLAVHSMEVARDLSTHLGLSDLERDLGVAGALLHDIGKVWSYTKDMFPNAASLAMGHELVGLCRLEPELASLEQAWPDGAYVMRSLLSGNPRVRGNGSLPSSLLQRIKACDQRSCERDMAMNRSRHASRPVWTPRTWNVQAQPDA